MSTKKPARPANIFQAPPRAAGAALPPAMAAQMALQQALAAHQEGRFAHAEPLYRQTLALQPKHADALHLLGVLLLQTQRVEAGAESIQKAVAVNPAQPAPHLNLGNALSMLGRHDEALASYDRALALEPRYADAHSNRASALRALGRQQDAVAACDAALALNPQLAEAHLTKGNALRDLMHLEEALGHHDQAVRLAPQHADAHLNRGLTLARLNRQPLAKAAFEQVIALAPAHAEAHSNLGVVLQEMGHLDAAVERFGKALALRPDHAEAHASLGVAYQEMGRLSQAQACFREALRLRPDYMAAHSNLLFSLSYDTNCSPADYVEEARRYGDKASAAATPYTSWSASGRTPLRVGLVSGDLKRHPVGFFLEGILSHIDRRQIELVAYPTEVNEDELTARLKPNFVSWQPIAALNDEMAARRIHEDRIDVLIDLAGHTAHNRLPVFAWRPAPVQFSWLGYLASTGVPAMDHLLADAISVPPQHERHFTEHIWRLPDTVNCFTPPEATPALEVPPLPALSQQGVTFGSFQNLVKITDQMLKLWAQVLQSVPASRLRIQNRQMAHEPARLDFVARLSKAGIDTRRVHLAGPVAGREDYLAAHGEVDIILDTFPYNGITTTCEALWMGVPTVTLAGGTLLSRQGASLLSCVGLGDWVAQDEATYVDMAARHAADLPSLAALRSRLRQQVLASPLFDPRLLASQLEKALCDMVRSRKA